MNIYEKILLVQEDIENFKSLEIDPNYQNPILDKVMIRKRKELNDLVNSIPIEEMLLNLFI